MNTGELLVSLSGLPSGAASTHLQAITTGTGTGTGETIYAAHFYTNVRQPKHTYVERRNDLLVSPSQDHYDSVVTTIDSGYIMSSTDSVE